ncbi:MAG: histidine phosphatase family protein [Anaerolineae bacterium]|jgi:broad specificity phosphatase PhoE
MDDAIRLILVRHGETEANLAGQWTGALETELTEHGRAQITAVAQRLAAEVQDLEAIYTSPLYRARQTAAGIGQELGQEPTVVEDLREVDFGLLDGVTIEEMKTHHPELYEQWKDRANADFTWPGGDRREDFFHRVAAACDQILSRHTQGTIIVVGHGGSLRSCLSHLLPQELSEWWTYPLSNCAVSEVIVEDGTARLVSLNDSAHLPGEESD